MHDKPSDMPMWHDDLFACYPAMIKRLQTLVADGTVKSIKEADDISDLVGSESNRFPLDGAIYVIFDSISVTNEPNNEGKNQEHEIGFSLVYTVKKYNFRALSGMSVGKVLARIGQCMNGFQPLSAEQGQDNVALTLSPFIQKNPLPVQYKNGFGYFSLRYTTTVATYATDFN